MRGPDGSRLSMAENMHKHRCQMPRTQKGKRMADIRKGPSADRGPSCPPARWTARREEATRPEPAGWSPERERETERERERERALAAVLLPVN